MFDPAHYIETVTLLGFRPFLAIDRHGVAHLREHGPDEPLSPDERRMYLGLQSARLDACPYAFQTELLRRGLVRPHERTLRAQHAAKARWAKHRARQG